MLYIGLNGYIGSGKDTVAKMLKIILNYDWKSKDDAKQFYKSYFDKHRYATLKTETPDDKCICIAFADQLKEVCALIFGIPVERFYYNKSNSWICINKDFEYREIQPAKECIVTADEYYASKDMYKHSDVRYYMSLRELLVYIGTYVCQADINKNIFVNIVNNYVKRRTTANKNIKYVICTDVRFTHEYEYIQDNNGIMINIVRDNVEHLDNIAEHDLDELDFDNYDYTVYNEGVDYDKLFDTVWDLVHNNIEFDDYVVELETRDSSNNYLRLVKSDEDSGVYVLCTEDGMLRIKYDELGEIDFIDPAGGPLIAVGSYIGCSDLMVKEIVFNEFLSKYFITAVQ